MLFILKCWYFFKFICISGRNNSFECILIVFVKDEKINVINMNGVIEEGNKSYLF